jgi:tetratricopeptide (TPR) repeat protein
MDREERLRRAEELVSAGRVEAAAAEYEALVAEYPRDLATTNVLGDLYVRSGQPDRACPHYEHVADSYAREGFFAKAAGFYKKLLKISPDSAVVIAKLGEVTARQGLVVEAIGHFRSLARLLESRGDARGVAEVMGRIEGLAHGQPAPATPRPWERGSSPAAHADHQAADAGLSGPTGDERARASGASSAPALGGLQPGAGRPAPPPTARLALARTYVAAGLLAEARPILEALNASDPGEVDAASLLADVLERNGEAATAIACLERAVAKHPEPSSSRVAALRRLGDALEHAGQRARALSLWREAIGLAPGDRELRERLSRASGTSTGGGPFTR